MTRIGKHLASALFVLFVLGTAMMDARAQGSGSHPRPCKPWGDGGLCWWYCEWHLPVDPCMNWYYVSCDPPDPDGPHWCLACATDQGPCPPKPK